MLACFSLLEYAVSWLYIEISVVTSFWRRAYWRQYRDMSSCYRNSYFSGSWFCLLYMSGWISTQIHIWINRFCVVQCMIQGSRRSEVSDFDQMFHYIPCAWGYRDQSWGSSFFIIVKMVFVENIVERGTVNSISRTKTSFKLVDK